jgi:23S rRNA (guanosine2251-2'-O)-methyltransferase
MRDVDSPDSDDLIVGVHPLKEALRTSNARLDQVLIRQGTRNRQQDEIFRLAKRARVPVKLVPSEALDRLARSLKHQGVLGYVSQKVYVSLDVLLEETGKNGTPPLFLMLDGVEDPRNMGAIIRTAEGAGVNGVVLPDRRAVGMTSVVARASAGALEHVAVTRVTNLSQGIERLKSSSVWVYGLDPNASKSYLDIDYRGSIAIVVGGEGKGIRPGVLKQCDDRVAIPMHGTVSSLNVSVAVAVLLYEVVRQRSQRA